MLSIARIWGTSFGLPHPGLMPNKREWQAQHDFVAEALKGLKRQGVEATGQVLSSRNAGKRILKEARRRNIDAIVMGADRPRHWLVNDMIWSQEPYRIRRLADMPVYLVEERAAGIGPALRRRINLAATNSIPMTAEIRVSIGASAPSLGPIGRNWLVMVVARLGAGGL